VRSKEEELSLRVESNDKLMMECDRLKEETNTFKGRCANL